MVAELAGTKLAIIIFGFLLYTFDITLCSFLISLFSSFHYISSIVAFSFVFFSND